MTVETQVAVDDEIVLQQEKEVLEKSRRWLYDQSLAVTLTPLLRADLLLSSSVDEILRRHSGAAIEQLRFLVSYVMTHESLDNFRRLWRCVEVSSPPDSALMTKVNDKRTSAGLEPIKARTKAYSKERQVIRSYLKDVCDTININKLLPSIHRKLKLSQAEMLMLREKKDSESKTVLILNNFLLKRTADDHVVFWRAVESCDPRYHALVRKVDATRVKYKLKELHPRQKGEVTVSISYSLQTTEPLTQRNDSELRVNIYEHIKVPLEKQKSALTKLLDVADVKFLRVLNDSLNISLLPKDAQTLRAVFLSLDQKEFATRFRQVLNIEELEKEKEMSVQHIKASIVRRELLRARAELVALGDGSDMWYTEEELIRIREQLLPCEEMGPGQGRLLVQTSWAEKYRDFIKKQTDELPGPVQYLEEVTAIDVEEDDSIEYMEDDVLQAAERQFGQKGVKLIMKDHEDLSYCLFRPGSEAPTHVPLRLLVDGREAATSRVLLAETLINSYLQLAANSRRLDPSKLPDVLVISIPKEKDEEDNDEEKDENQENEEAEEEETEEEKEAEKESEDNKEENTNKSDEKQDEEAGKEEEVKPDDDDEEDISPLVAVQRWIWRAKTVEGFKELICREKPPEPETTDEQTAENTKDEQTKPPESETKKTVRLQPAPK